MKHRSLLVSAGILLLAVLTLFCVQRLPTSIATDISLRLNALLEDQGLDWAHISVDGRDVFIDGEAPSNDDMLRAVELAETLDGVRVVYNRQHILQQEAVATVSSSPDFMTAISLKDGKVVMTGNVPDEESRELLLSLARAQFGEAYVVDQLAINPDVPDDWRQIVSAVVMNLAGFQEAAAAITPGKLLLHGVTRDRQMAETILDHVRTSLPENIDPDLMIQPAEEPRDLVGSVQIGETPRPLSVDDALVLLADAVRQAESVAVTPELSFDDALALLADAIQQESSAGQREQLPDAAESPVFMQMPTDGEEAAATGAPASQPGVQVAQGPAETGDVADVTASRADTGSRNLAASSIESQPVGEAAEGTPDETTEQVPASGTWFSDDGFLVDSTAAEEAEEKSRCLASINAMLIGKRVNFRFDSNIVATSYNGMLDKIVAVAILCPEVIIQVEGHTDSTGPMAYNQRLSERRAEAGATVLNTRGIWKEQLAKIGYGETRPIATNRTAAGRAKNRRIEFKVQETQP